MLTLKLTFIPLVAASCAYAATYYEWLDLPHWIWVPVTILVSSVVLLFSIARKARKLEEIKIHVDYSYQFIHGSKNSAIYIKLENTSSIRLDGAECVLSRIIIGDSDGDSWQPINRNLFFVDSSNNLGGSSAINPGATKLVKLCELNIENDNKHIATDFGTCLPGSKNILLFELEISAANSPATIEYFRIELLGEGKSSMYMQSELKKYVAR